MSRIIALLIIAFSAMISSARAETASIAFDIDEKTFAAPAMHFSFANGAFVWDGKPVIAAFTASGSLEHGFAWKEDALLVPGGAGGQPLEWRMPSARHWAHSGSIILPKSFLAPYAAQFADLCSGHTAAGEIEFDNLEAAFSFVRGYSSGGKLQQAVTAVRLPMTISCAVRPLEPAAKSRLAFETSARIQ